MIWARRGGANVPSSHSWTELLAAAPHPACVTPRNLLECSGVIQFGWYN